MKNTKYKVSFMTSGLLTGCLVASMAGAVRTGLEEKPVVLSKGTFDSFVTDETPVYSLNTNQETEYIYLSDDTRENLEFLALSATKSNLAKLTDLTIDANEFDFNDLSYLTGLESLTITNAIHMNSDEFELLKKCSASKITLQYDDYYTDQVKSIPGKTLVVDVSNAFFASQSVELCLYHNYIHTQDDSVTYLFKNESQLKEWDSYMQNVVDSMHMEDYSNLEKIGEITKYVTDYYTYDPTISEVVESGVQTEETLALTSYYNDNEISHYIKGESHYGICTNYASLCHVLLTYAGIPVNYDYGYLDDLGGHAWVDVTLNGKDYYLDLTTLDEFPQLDEFKKEYDQETDPSMRALYREGIANGALFLVGTQNANHLYSIYKDSSYNDINYINKDAQEFYYKEHVHVAEIALLFAALSVASYINLHHVTKEMDSKKKVLQK